MWTDEKESLFSGPFDNPSERKVETKKAFQLVSLLKLMPYEFQKNDIGIFLGWFIVKFSLEYTRK